ncbi:hypothetical protein [Nocardia aurantiaca]|uniref:DNA primase n=1 Tax=Nocardia aurantiaca TaxID=2675850 RepID=A0A6I3KX24_9NOCA|nr:hypothetical protein [Nocardia aurantiaca]MTE14602.1 hypothetical protein [Nocardia aurantiaca]
MKGGTRIALGVGIGYVLGRTRKMRFALSLAGAAMARRNTGMTGELLERGTSLLKSSPELAQLTDTVREELVGAVRSAAVTATSNRLDALSARLQQGSTLVADRGPDEGETDSYEEEEDDERRGRPAARARAGSRETSSGSSQRRSGSTEGKSASSVRGRARADAGAAPVRRARR